MFKSYDKSSGVSLRSSKVGNQYLTHTERESERERERNETDWMMKIGPE